MTTEKKIGFKQRVPAYAFREALREFFPTCKIDPEVVRELLAGYFVGEHARYRSQLHITASLNNEELRDFFDKNALELDKACSIEQESLHVCFALLCARYSFCYDIAVELAKLFRLQDEVSKELIANSISKKYGFNENVKRSMERFLAFCEEANLVDRPYKSTYRYKTSYLPQCEVTKNLWKKVYMVNEPLRETEENPDLPFEPFFRYLQLI